MSGFPVTDEDITRLRIKILRALAAARFPREAIGAVALNNKLTVDDVKALVAQYGWPNAAQMAEAALELAGGGTPTPAPPKQVAKQVSAEPVARGDVIVPAPEPSAVFQLAEAQPSTNDGILAAAERSEKARTRRLATKVREQLAELRGLVNTEETERKATAAAAAEKARLRGEVEKLEAELAEKRAALKKAGGVAAATQPSVVDSKAVRAWAAENGIECKPFGRVSPDVVAAYDAAMSKAGSR